MSEQQVDTGRRRFLTVATSAAGGVAAAAVATPFVMSFFPSERAKAAGAPVEVDISKLEPGQKIRRRVARQAGVGSEPDTKDHGGQPCQDRKQADRPRLRTVQRSAGVLPRTRRVPVPIKAGIYWWLWGCVPTWAARRLSVPIWPRLISVPGLDGWFLLPLPRLQVRPGRPRLFRRARSQEPRHPARTST